MNDEITRAQRLIGRVLGDKFRLTACIGIGGTGAVYRADQIALGRTIAVKVLNEELAADARLVKRFRDEATAASRLNHPNTVSIIDYGQANDGLLYLAMEYLRGPTLTQLIAREHPLPVGRVLDVVCQVLSGIEEAHLAGVVHADLKSDNIIVDQRRAGTDVVKIVDFGIARLVTAPREGEDRNICGTPEYMAPEVISGAPPGFAADLYAVGIILYELLTCQTPFFGGTTIEILGKHLRAEAEPPSRRRPEMEISSELDALIRRALAKHPNDRFPSAVAMRQAVVGLADRLSVPAATKIEDATCPACNARCAPTFRFCPECGYPRAPRHTVELGPAATIAPDLEHIFPLPLIGMSSEQRAIVDHLRGKSHTAGMLVIGPPGSGRTRLVQDTCAVVAGQVELTVYQTGGDPSGLASTYYPIRAVVAALLSLPAMCTEEELRKAVRSLDLTDADLFGIAQLFGNASPLLEVEPPIRRRETVQSVLRVIQAVAARGKLAVVFDDVDSYDYPSLEVLRRLAEGATSAPQGDAIGMPIVLVTEPEHAQQWPADLPRVAVEPLDAGELVDVAKALHRHDPHAPSAAVLFEHSRGNPAHVEHLMRFLLEGGRLTDESGALSLADLIAARLSMLAQPTLELCQTAAVFGSEVDLELLRMATMVSDLDTALKDARVRGLVAGDTEVVRFASGLIRDVVYDATPADVRRAFHAAAADALDATSSDVALLGHHHDLAGHAGRAVGLLGMAGDRASIQLDDVGAGQLYQRALVAVRVAVRSGDDDDNGDGSFVQLSVKLAEALRSRGENGLARGVVAEARTWADTPALDASLDRAHAMIVAAEDDHESAATYLRRGIGRAIACGDMSLVCDLYIDLANVLVRLGEIDAARRELAECIDLVTLGEGLAATAGPDNLWMVLRRKAQIVATLGETERALRLSEGALHHAVRAKSRLGKARVQTLLAELCDKLGQSSRADRYRKAAVEEMRRLGDRRATAELLLTDTSSVRSVRVFTGEIPQPSRTKSPPSEDIESSRRNTGNSGGSSTA
jgi:serine/threonine-protein kinase